MLAIRVDMGTGEKWNQNPPKTEKEDTTGLSVGFVQIWLFCKCTSIHTNFFFHQGTTQNYTLRVFYVSLHLFQQKNWESAAECRGVSQQSLPPHCSEAITTFLLSLTLLWAPAAPECLKSWSVRHQPALSKHGTDTSIMFLLSQHLLDVLC